MHPHGSINSGNLRFLVRIALDVLATKSIASFGSMSNRSAFDDPDFIIVRGQDKASCKFHAFGTRYRSNGWSTAEQLCAIAISTSAAVASKCDFVVNIANGMPMHFLNPFSFGIVLTLVLFPNVGIASPYQFGEILSRVFDWFFPALICMMGFLIKYKLTGRMPLTPGLAGWFAVALASGHRRRERPAPAAEPTGLA